MAPCKCKLSVKGQKYFDEYKNYFVDKIIKRKIDGIYVIGKEDENTPQLVLDRDYLNKEIIDEIITTILLIKNVKILNESIKIFSNTII